MRLWLVQLTYPSTVLRSTTLRINILSHSGQHLSTYLTPLVWARRKTLSTPSLVPKTQKATNHSIFTCVRVMRRERNVMYSNATHAVACHDDKDDRDTGNGISNHVPMIYSSSLPLALMVPQSTRHPESNSSNNILHHHQYRISLGVSRVGSFLLVLLILLRDATRYEPH